MEVTELEDRLRRALAPLQEIEFALDDGDGPDVGKRATLFALADVDDARDALITCGARFGLTDLEGVRA